MNATYTKADVLTPKKFAAKYKLSLKLLQIVLDKLHRERITVTNNHIPVVLRNRASHRSNSFAIHPLGYDIVLDRYAKEQKIMQEKIKNSTVALDAAIKALDKKTKTLTKDQGKIK